jgi:O-antigen ligase
MNRRRAAVAEAGFYFLAVAVAFAAVPLGSVDAASAGVLGLLLSFSLISSLLASPPAQAASRIIGVTVLLCAGLIAWTTWQVLPNAAQLYADRFWAASSELAGGTSAPLTSARYQPLASIGYVILPLATFVAALANIRDTRGFTRSADIILGISGAVSAAALLQYWVYPGGLLLDEKRHYLESFTGTFVNPNTAATYFGVLTLLSLALMSRPWSVLRPMTFLRSNRRWLPDDSRQAAALVFYAGLAFIFALALFLTRSRAGVVASLAALAALAAGQAFLSLRRKYSTMTALSGCLLAIGAVGGLFAIFGSRLMLRIETEGLVDEQRLCTYRSTWQAIKEHFLWGTGAGTFQDVFPAYRADACGIEGYWEMAHSVPLEGLLTFGGAFLAATLIAYVTLIAIYAKGLRERRRYRYSPLACLSILLLITLHSIVDFSLQIPAVALLVAWVLGAGAAISVGRSSEASSAPSAD